MTPSAKEEKKCALELAQFENFLAATDQSFEHYEHGIPKVEPDILAFRGGKNFGIEITSYHREEEKQRDGEAAETVEAALRIYERGGCPKVGAEFLWAPHYRLAKRDRDKLALIIARVVQQNIPETKGVVHLTWQNFDRDLTMAIDSIWVDRQIDYKANLWRCSGGGSVPDWDTATLQSKVDLKNGKPKNYQATYDEIWLVIISAFGKRSSWMEMTDAVRTHPFRTTYDRLFLLSSFPFKVFELECGRK